MNSNTEPVIHYGLEGQNYPLVLLAKGGWENEKLWQGSFTITKDVPSTGNGNYLFTLFNAESDSIVKMDTTYSVNLQNK